MKTSFAYILALCVVLLVGCVADVEPLPKGWLCVEAPGRDTTLTRGSAEEKYLVSVTHGSTTLLAPTPYAQIEGDSIPLRTGQGYVLMAESISEADAESKPTNYGQPRYAAKETFNIEAGKKTQVELTCTMANAAFKVQKDASFYFSSFTLSATVGTRELTFTDESQLGYFNVGADGTATLAYAVEATDDQGNTATGQGTITLRARTQSTLRLKANPQGSIEIAVTYDDSFTPIPTPLPVE